MPKKAREGAATANLMRHQARGHQRAGVEPRAGFADALLHGLKVRDLLAAEHDGAMGGAHLVFFHETIERALRSGDGGGSSVTAAGSNGAVSGS
mgnify:CR=1 FL=1